MYGDPGKYLNLLYVLRFHPQISPDSEKCPPRRSTLFPGLEMEREEWEEEEVEEGEEY